MHLLSWLFLRGNDLTTQFLPDALFFKTSILSGKFPFWNPWIFAGMPYVLDPQNFLWYPPNYVLFFLPLELGFLVLLIGHLIFAGYFIKKLLDQFPRWVQWFGVFLFLFSPKLIGHLEEGNWTLVIAATWLPVFYWSLINKRFWWTSVTLAFLLINNLNIGYYGILFALLWWIIHKPPIRRVFGVLLVAMILSAPRWVPLVLWGHETVRASLSDPSLPFWSWTKIVKSIFLPLTRGHPQLQNEEILYVGTIPIVLLLIHYVRSLSKKRRHNIFWGVWVVFLLIVALNIKTPLFSLIKLLPGFSLLRITTRPWIFVALFVALTLPAIIFQLSKKSKLLTIFLMIGIVGEFGVFGYRLIARRVIPKDPLPFRFYEEMIQEGVPVRAYCTTGCIDRLTAQQKSIALLHGNNPIQLKKFVEYLEEAGGYHESTYIPILPPYTVFSRRPQPNAVLLGKTSTEFVVSPYELTDSNFELVDQEGEYRLYRNLAAVSDFKPEHFELKGYSSVLR